MDNLKMIFSKNVKEQIQTVNAMFIRVMYFRNIEPEREQNNGRLLNKFVY